MKAEYENPEMEIVEFKSDDVITTSDDLSQVFGDDTSSGTP